MDVVIIRLPVAKELATGGGLTLAFQRYKRDDVGRSCSPSVILSKAQIRTGVYVGGVVSFRLRVDVDDEEPEGPGLIEAPREAKGLAALSRCGPRMVDAISTNSNPHRASTLDTP